MNAAQLLAILRASHDPAPGRPSVGLFATEVPSPDGHRRADALWLPTTWAERDELVGYELKVSRADVLAELRDPAKADAWSRWCTRWWLVVSEPVLVDGLQVPPHWGVMAPPSGRLRRSMTVLTPAPLLTPSPGSAGVRRLLVWHLGQQERAVANLRAELATAHGTADGWRRQAEELRAGGAGRDPRSQLVAAVLAELDKLGAAHQLAWQRQPAQLIARVLADHLTVERATRDALSRVQQMVQQAQRITEPIRRVGRELEALERGERRRQELAAWP